MKPADLARAVARATGESVRVIRSLGFSVVKPPSDRGKYLRQVYRRMKVAQSRNCQNDLAAD